MAKAKEAAAAAPPPAVSKATAPANNRPVHEIRNRNIRATIWRNQTPKGTIYNVTVSRSYRDGDQWKDSGSFAFGDLMNLAKALYDAHSAIAAVIARERAAKNAAPASAPSAER